jgi:aldehyde:ferredoxin oxidoreductase
MVPLRAMGPVYLNEYESRAEYYDSWLKENAGDGALPERNEEKLNLLIEKRRQQFERLSDLVYQRKGYTIDGIPKRETVIKFDLLDEQASKLLNEYIKK